MKIGFWKIQTDIEKAFKDLGYKMVGLDWHSGDWQKDFIKANCDAYVWYPHALHRQWHKLLDRAFFIENFLNKKSFPDSRTSYLFQDKLHQKYIFDLFNIPTPKTNIITGKQELEKFKKEFAPPFLVKDIWGYGGDDISLIKTNSEFNQYVKNKQWPANEAKILPPHYIYAQELVNIEKEYRVVTVGQKVILTYEKKSDHLLKHVWRGAEIIWEVEKDVKKFIEKYNKILKLDWCGWDVIRDKSGRLIMLELNPIFGTISLEQKGINLAERLAEYIDKKLKQ